MYIEESKIKKNLFQCREKTTAEGELAHRKSLFDCIVSCSTGRKVVQELKYKKIFFTSLIRTLQPSKNSKKKKLIFRSKPKNIPH